VKQEILAQLEQVRTMLEEATCNGRQFALCDSKFKETIDYLGDLEQAVQHYVDDDPI
jgi:hypothetical protein